MEEIPQTLNTIKASFDIFRAAIGLAKDIQEQSDNSEDEKRAIGHALEEAEKTAKVAEAQLAQALGYTLCKCEYPPNPMLKIGYRDKRDQKSDFPDVHECPMCKTNDAGPYGFTRTVEPIE